MTYYDAAFDAEPEDSWDRDDTVAEQLANLVRRVELLIRHKVRTGGDPDEVLDAIAELVRKARRRRLAERELLRADQIDEDVTFVRARL